VSTSTDASKSVNIIARSFWVPWKMLYLRVLERSRLMILPPTKSCSIIDADTIGPIPRVIIEPKLPARTALNDENWSTACGLSPKKCNLS